MPSLRDHLPGETTAPAAVSGAQTISYYREVVLDPVSGHDLSRHTVRLAANPTTG